MWQARRKRTRQFEETALPHLAAVYRYALAAFGVSLT